MSKSSSSHRAVWHTQKVKNVKDKETIKFEIFSYRFKKSLSSPDNDSGISGCVLNIPTLKMAAAGSSCLNKNCKV